MRNCAIEGCGNSVSENSEHDTCLLCRGSRWYWRKKRPAQILERRRKLTMYGSRLENFFGVQGKGVGK